MANEVTVDVEINAPAAAVFAYLTDYTTAPDYIMGLESFEPLTEQTSGVGAKFEGAIKLGARLAAGQECIEYVEGESFALKSFKGVSNQMRWVITPVTETTSRAHLVWEYDLGSGLTGKALNKVVQPFVQIAANHARSEIKKHIEG